VSLINNDLFLQFPLWKFGVLINEDTVKKINNSFMVHPCCALILQWCRKWRYVGTSVLCACVWRPEAPGVPWQGISGSPTWNIRFPGKEYQVSRQGISGSQQGAIIVQTVKLLFCMFNLCSHMKMFNFLALKSCRIYWMSVTVHLPALQSMVITKHYSSQYIVLPWLGRG
jgi:hypothetical protein